jgi:hypothetical protein
MWEFCLTELATFYSWLFIDIPLHYLDKRNLNFKSIFYIYSIVGIVSGYGMDARRVEVRI